MSDAETYFRENRDRHLAELAAFLRIPSQSALPEHAPDVRAAAGWVADHLRGLGFPRVEIMPTAGHPVVLAEWRVAPDRPTVVIYGHYDVQPVDPLTLWTSPPFEPAVRDGKLYARGASDDKGNLFIAVKALEALARLDGGPPLNVKFMLEGEEEVGSPSLPGFMAAHKDLLSGDLAVSADGGMFGTDTPSLTVGSRGICALQLDVRGANHDLHSGMYGGAVQNPVHALVALLASMRGPDGRIAVAGFYDRVRPPGPEERAEMARVPFDEAAYKAALGVEELHGEAGYTTLERAWARPTLEVNGIWGGFQGDGLKTVLPAEAHAKLTCRLVPDQEPEAILDAIEAHVERFRPPGVRVSVRRFPGSARPYSLPASHPGQQAAAKVLKAVYGKEPLVIRAGGTLPVAEMFASILGVPLVFFAFGGPDSNVHAPDECLPLDAFDRGVRAYYRYLHELARSHPAAG